MITNLKIGNMGRIGNQLFQYSFLRGISLKLNHTICLPKNSDLIFHGQHFLLKKFNLNCEFSDEIKPNNFYKEEMPNVYDERVFESLTQLKKLALRDRCVNPFVKTILFML